jgi:quinol monooxygenase YgiN
LNRGALVRVLHGRRDADATVANGGRTRAGYRAAGRHMKKPLVMDGGRVRLELALGAQPGTANRMVEALRFLMMRTRFDAGCLTCTVWTDQDSTVHYVEEWATEADMRRRVRSEAFTSLLAVVESSRERPQVQFDFVASTRGLDYIEEVRQHSTP